jgi:hypothetical protein
MVMMNHSGRRPGKDRVLSVATGSALTRESGRVNARATSALPGGAVGEDLLILHAGRGQQNHASVLHAPRRSAPSTRTRLQHVSLLGIQHHGSRHMHRLCSFHCQDDARTIIITMYAALHWLASSVEWIGISVGKGGAGEKPFEGFASAGLNQTFPLSHFKRALIGSPLASTDKD